VSDSRAGFGADGSCRLAAEFDEPGRSWPSVRSWADEWVAEKRAERHGDASEFLEDACEYAVPGVVDALAVLADVASLDADMLGLVGAGPLEDLLSHSGNGARVLGEVERAARQGRAFRAALRSVWLGGDVPEKVRARLVELGASDVS
jgi:hypothetical protein